jgi:hypothetical protein
MLAIPVAMLATGLMACIPKADAGQVSAEPAASDLDGNCIATGLDKHIGKTLTPELEKQMKKEAGTAMVRTGPHDGVITMDYNPGRLNIFHNDKKVIVRVNCG